MTLAEQVGTAGETVLAGSLEHISLWDVLQWLAASRTESLLWVPEPACAPAAAAAWVHCRDGCVRAVSRAPAGRISPEAPLAPRAERLGGCLCAGHGLSVAHLRLVLALQPRAAEGGAAGLAAGAAQGPLLGQLLVAQGWITAETLRAALAELARRRLARLLAVHSGRFTVDLGPPPAPGLPLEEPVEPLLLAIAQEVDQGAIDGAAGAAGEAPPESQEGLPAASLGADFDSAHDCRAGPEPPAWPTGRPDHICRL